MLRGLYTAASGMLSVSMAEDTLANNLANVNTVGFKKNNVNFESFPEMLINRMGQGGAKLLAG
jgi:flagellar basal-body rod protein FlgF